MNLPEGDDLLLVRGELIYTRPESGRVGNQDPAQKPAPTAAAFSHSNCSSRAEIPLDTCVTSSLTLRRQGQPSVHGAYEVIAPGGPAANRGGKDRAVTKAGNGKSSASHGEMPATRRVCAQRDHPAGGRTLLEERPQIPLNPGNLVVSPGTPGDPGDASVATLAAAIAWAQRDSAGVLGPLLGSPLVLIAWRRRCLVAITVDGVRVWWRGGHLWLKPARRPGAPCRRDRPSMSAGQFAAG